MAQKKREEIRDADEVIRDYYARDAEGAFRDDGTEPVSFLRATGERTRSPELFGGDMDAALDQSDVGTETVGGSNPTPDQDIVDELGKGAGVTYDDHEPLKFGDKTAERDQRRWELDPASSEDYQARTGNTDRSSSSSTTPSGPSVETQPAKPARARARRAGMPAPDRRSRKSRKRES